MAESDLPEEVMMSILCWLPVKSLIRFTSVSKRWRFIILSDPQFAASQFEAARQRKTLVPRLIFSTNAPQLESVDVADTASFGHPSSIRKISLPLERLRGDVTLLGSCNGLVCVSFEVSCFYMWNPATRFFRELPEPGFPDVCPELTFRGVGYLSATNDYRVFASAYGLYPAGDSYAETEETRMFSSRANVWKTIQDPRHYKCCPIEGILLNEVLHWRKLDEIVAFDFAPEKFRTMRLPDIDDQYDVAFGYLGVSEGCLCVCGYLSGRDDSVDFWVMREYGVENSWTKLFNFSHGDPGRYIEWWVMESCTVAVKRAIGLHHWLLVKIDHQQEAEIGDYMVPGINNCYPTMIPYEDTLLRIND